jgi:hypothetical protein
MLFLARWARRLSWKETAEAFRSSWNKVFDEVENVLTFGLEHHQILSGILHDHRRRTGFEDCRCQELRSIIT